ncbi:MAG TPA: type II toxin-antitoxin system HicA family toxin [Candidatus Saccharimonadales bacterium]|nr:type II toxin-antitoxin system HicA family toxin [Candidatus Saccharimonadales bacterium]
MAETLTTPTANTDPTQNPGSQLEVVDQLPEDQRDLVGMYEEVFTLPQGTVEEGDQRRKELDAVNELAASAGADATLIGLLRHTAFLRVEDAKRRQAARTENPSEPALATAETTELEPDRAGRQTAHEGEHLRAVKRNLALTALTRMGIVVEKSKGTGHYKIEDPETGRKSVFSLHKGKEISPQLLKKVLAQIGRSPDEFIDQL